MKKMYDTPQMDISLIGSEDILTSSAQKLGYQKDGIGVELNWIDFQ